jgi:hypothetical protein
MITMKITIEPIKVYFWQKINAYDPKISFIPMGEFKPYNPENNARQIARFIMNSLPGNTVDVLFKAIANEIMPMLESQEKINILKSPYDIENRIRCALNNLENERGQ